MSAHSDPTATLLPDGPAARIEPVMGGGGLAFMGGEVQFAENPTGVEEKIPADELDAAEESPVKPNEGTKPNTPNKPTMPSVTFTEEEQKILSDYGLGPGGPISLDVDELTKQAFLKQRTSKTCAKGTGDVVIMNSKCWAVVAVIRALLRHNIRSANSLPVPIPVEDEPEEEEKPIEKPNLPVFEEAIHTLLEKLQEALTQGKPLESFRLSVLKHLLKFPAGRSYVIHKLLSTLPEELEKKETEGLQTLKERIQSALAAVQEAK